MTKINLTILLVLMCGVFAMAAPETHYKSKNVTKYADAKKESRYGVLKIEQDADEEEEEEVKPLSYTSYKKAYASKKKEVKTPEHYEEESYEKESDEEMNEYAESNEYDRLVQMEGGPAYEKPVEYKKMEKKGYEKKKSYHEKKNYDYVPAFKPLIYGELGRRQAFVAENFTLNLNRVYSENPSATGGTLQRLTQQNMPGLQDLSLSLKYLKPCSINFPSYHPRASELIYVIEGEDLLVGFAEENGGRVIINELSTKGTSFIPRGLIHFEMNMGCKPVSYLSIYSNVDPGIVYMSRGFDLPIEVIESNFNLSEEQIHMIKNYLPLAPHEGLKNFGFHECIEKCKYGYETESYEVKKEKKYATPTKKSKYAYKVTPKASTYAKSKTYKPKPYEAKKKTDTYSPYKKTSY